MSAHNFIEHDKRRDRYQIILHGGLDESRFGRVFLQGDTSMYQLRHRRIVVKDGEVKRQAIEIWYDDIPLEELSARTKDFATLPPIELSALADRLKVTETEPMKMLEAIRARAKEPKVKEEAKVPRPIVIPADLMAMNMPNLLTKAGELGVSTKGPGGRDVDEDTLRGRIVKRMGQPVGANQ